jgi:hypothetical protein
MAASIWRPVLACWPVMGRMTPIFTLSPCALALPWASSAARVRAERE